MIETIEIAFQKIDKETLNTQITSNIEVQKTKIVTNFNELETEIYPLYENINEALKEKSQNDVTQKCDTKENKPSHKSPNKFICQNKQLVSECLEERYDQTPNEQPYYENMQLRGPPREKPPPPPAETLDVVQQVNNCLVNNETKFECINSTHHINKKIWNKQSSFFDIEERTDTLFEFDFLYPTDVEVFSGKRVQRQLIKQGFCNNTYTGSHENLF